MQENLSTIAQRTTHNAQRTTHNAQRTTHNAQRTTHNAQRLCITQNSDEAIHVVLLVYDPLGTYSQHAGVVMTSIFENTLSKVIVHILHDETLTDDNRKNLLRTAEKYSQGISFEDVSEYKKGFTNKATDLARRKCTIGALYRFFVPELLKDLRKVIYLDCDIVVNLDIREMWNIDVKDYCIAGVHSEGFETLSEGVRDWLNGSSSKTFINSGVMLMNLDKMRERGNFFNNAMEWIEQHVHLMKFSDQDVINNLFYGSIKLIDRKFNNGNPQTWEQVQESIVHTPHPVYGFKTWGTLGLPSQRLYWKYYVRSAWGEGKSIEDLAEVILKSAEKSSATYNHSIPSYIGEILRRVLCQVCSTLINLMDITWCLLRRVFYARSDS